MRRDIDTLLERLERIKLARDMEPDPDALSLSLWAFEDEMANLDEIGIAALTVAIDEDGKPILTPEQVRQMVGDFKRNAADRRICALNRG